MTEKERQRLEDLWRFDMEKGQGRPVYGMDEVGRGPLAGPVVAACVWMPETWIEGVKDSKKIAEKKRERIAEQIKDKALAYGIGLADVAEIERLNILNATKLAMQRAYEQMPKQDSYVMIDAIDPAFLPAEGEGVVRGDAQSYAIAAASILAKVTRDALMKAYEMAPRQYKSESLFRPDHPLPRHQFERFCYLCKSVSHYIERLLHHAPLSTAAHCLHFLLLPAVNLLWLLLALHSLL